MSKLEKISYKCYYSKLQQRSSTFEIIEKEGKLYMACLIRIANAPTYKPQDIFLPSGQELAFDPFSIKTNPNQTVIDFKKDYEQAQVRNVGNIEGFFGETGILDNNTDLINVKYDNTTFLFWHLSQESYDTLLHYADLAPDL